MSEERKEYRTQIRFPADVWDKIKRLAEEHDRSLNGEVIRAVREYISRQEGTSEYVPGETGQHRQDGPTR